MGHSPDWTTLTLVGELPVFIQLEEFRDVARVHSLGGSCIQRGSCVFLWNKNKTRRGKQELHGPRRADCCDPQDMRACVCVSSIGVVDDSTPDGSNPNEDPSLRDPAAGLWDGPFHSTSV